MTVAPPPEQFNIADHLLAANAGRPDKTAFVDDSRSVAFGQIDERVRRFAAGLRDLLERKARQSVVGGRHDSHALTRTL